ncbi:MAG: Rab geranylgeranyltransferase [Caeruleum heppii]|nr:MAG: Rab geranylgeranyltransferase [Caeruleum heppii]
MTTVKFTSPHFEMGNLTESQHGVPRGPSIEHRSEAARQKELQKITEYRDLVATVQSKIQKREYTQETLDSTSKLLALNPEYYTIWNHRRRILLHGLFPAGSSSDTLSSSPDPSAAAVTQSQDHETALTLIRSDLSFLIPLLSQYPKCYWIWNYRLWLLQQALLRLPKPTARELWTDELRLVSKMLSRDSRNFLGWGYRRMVVGKLESPALYIPPTQAEGQQDEKSKDEQRSSMVEEEFQYTTNMIQTNLSNFSAWHQRSVLIPRLLQERKSDERAREEFIQEELTLITRALYTDPYDSSIWFYHQFVVSHYLPPPPTHEASSHRRSAVDLPPYTRLRRLTCDLLTLEKLLDGGEDCRLLYEALLRYSVAALRLRKMADDAGEEVDRWKTGEGHPVKMERWLRELRGLDPMRSGRWDDLEKELKEVERWSVPWLSTLGHFGLPSSQAYQDLEAWKAAQ